MSSDLSQFGSQFEENLYQLRREKLEQIARLALVASPELLEGEAKFPNSFRFTQTVPELRAMGEPKSTEELEASRIEAAIAGRIMAIRVQGKAGFAQIQQGGQRLQIYVRKDDVGETLFAMYKLLDLGDHVGVSGYMMRTRTGELTLHAQSLTFLTKAMLALPDKYHGLEDVETRYRQRYVDLIVNSGTLVKEAVAAAGDGGGSNTQVSEARPGAPGAEAGLEVVPGVTAVTDAAAANAEHEDAPINVREVFVKRAAVLRAIRRFFDERGYLEVETPMLHTVAGGAAARPFKTHHNALDIPLSLRIAPELYLKRLVVGGLDRVYEINRNFRNEGVSTRHNPEFTMLEFYQAYANYHDLMDLTVELIKSVAVEVNGATVTHFNGNEIDLGKWTKLSMREAILRWWPRPAIKPGMEMFANPESFEAALITAQTQISQHLASTPDVTDDDIENGDPDVMAERLAQAVDVRVSQIALGVAGVNLQNGLALGKVIAELFEALAEEHLIQPTIIYDFPLAVSPLSKVKPDEPDWVERFEFYIGGFEVGNAFSELNDPDDQRARFLAQVEAKAGGDEEAMAEIDEDYVRALGYGLPPTAGEGIGIDRLTMLLTGSRSIRDVILFPLMRPIAKTAEPMEEHGESAE